MLAQKQEELFKQWLGEHKKLILKIVRACAFSLQDQDDLFQEILLQLWSSIPGFDRKARETTWIYRVALNTALVWKRTAKRARQKYQRFIIDINQTSDAQQGTSDSSNQQILDQLYAAIRKLPKIEGSIILMHLDGLSYNEMAEILGISTNNVGVKLNRAKKQLSQFLKGLVDEF